MNWSAFMLISHWILKNADFVENPFFCTVSQLKAALPFPDPCHKLGKGVDPRGDSIRERSRKV